jgi:hypothetical protein
MGREAEPHKVLPSLNGVEGGQATSNQWLCWGSMWTQMHPAFQRPQKHSIHNTTLRMINKRHLEPFGIIRWREGAC